MNFEISTLSAKLSRCPITNENGEITLRPADDYAKCCDLEQKLRLEKEKRLDRVVSGPLQTGEPPPPPRDQSYNFYMMCDTTVCKRVSLVTGGGGAPQ